MTTPPSGLYCGLDSVAGQHKVVGGSLLVDGIMTAGCCCQFSEARFQYFWPPLFGSYLAAVGFAPCSRRKPSGHEARSSSLLSRESPGDPRAYTPSPQSPLGRRASLELVRKPT